MVICAPRDAPPCTWRGTTRALDCYVPEPAKPRIKTDRIDVLVFVLWVAVLLVLLRYL